MCYAWVTVQNNSDILIPLPEISDSSFVEKDRKLLSSMTLTLSSGWLLFRLV